MKASEFGKAFGNLAPHAREAKAWEVIRAGGFVEPVWKPIVVGDGGGRIFVAADYFELGEVGDSIRFPMSPLLAQRIADRFGWNLPSRKIVNLAWKNAEARIDPAPWGQPYDASMLSWGRFVAHNARIEEALLRKFGNYEGKLVAGMKKDVVIARNLRPGKVAIFGWHRANGKPIQDLNGTSHDAKYADYSHGLRFVLGEAEKNGAPIALSDLFADPVTAWWVSDEGVLTSIRQPGTKYEGKADE